MEWNFLKIPGCPLYQKFWKVLLHSSLELPKNLKFVFICQNLEFASYEERPEIPGTSIQNVLISAKGLIHIYTWRWLIRRETIRQKELKDKIFKNRYFTAL